MTDVQYQTALSLHGQGRHAEGTQLLGQAAEAGHVPAMTLLGQQLLSGRGAPRNPIVGIRLIMSAAGKGGGAACATAAALLAAGVTGAPEWDRALDYLERAAGLDFPKAQAQLRLLAGREGDDWDALRRSVDIAAWRQAPEGRPLCEGSRLYAFKGVASAAVCDWIIANARERLTRATVYDDAGGRVLSQARTNSFVELSLADGNVVAMAVRERLAVAAGAPFMHLDAPQVLHYATGESFAPHVDFFDPAEPSRAAEIGAKGQRIATALLYLNDEGLEGGETDFPLLGVRHRGRKGDALVFHNVDPSGEPDRQTLHAGLPPVRGEKWLLSQWIRDRAPKGPGDPRLVAAVNGTP